MSLNIHPKEKEKNIKLSQEFNASEAVIEFIRRRRLVPQQTNREFFIKHQQEVIARIVVILKNNQQKLDRLINNPKYTDKVKLLEDYMDSTQAKGNLRIEVANFVSKLDDHQWKVLIR